MEKHYDVTIEYVNEIRCRVKAERNIFSALRSEFSFYANGYKFHPLYKQGKWSGQISMIDGKGLFYNGLIKNLVKYCVKHNLKVNIQNPEKYLPQEISDNEIEKLKSYIKFSPYDYQEVSVKKALSKKKLLVLSPTSSGKSLIIYMLYRYCIDNGLRLLINVPSTSLCEQLFSDFESYVSDEHIVENHVSKLYGGQDKENLKEVVISTWQTCINMPKEWLSSFDFYICDEAHRSSARDLSTIIDSLENCQYRIGLTGTLNGSSIHEIEMNARFGDIFKMVTTRELIDRGIVTEIEIKVMNLQYDKDEVKRFHSFVKKDYMREIDYIINSESRNNYITDLALNLKGNTLVLFNRVEEHGERLYEALKDDCERVGKTLLMIHGKVKTKDREIIRKSIDEAPKLVGKKISIGGNVYCFKANETIMLSNGEMKLITDLNINDDIDEMWILENGQYFKDFKR